MSGRTLVAAMVVAAFVGQAVVQSAAAATAVSKAHEEAELGSVFLRCDGAPAHRTAAETAGRLLLIMATAGLAGPGELRDTSKRLKGGEAVTACDAALAGESDAIRKVQLTLARAVHQIEAKNFEAALSDARNAPALAGKDGEELGFKHSLLLSSYDLEAQALVRLNRPAEAEIAALKLAAASPYDLLAQQQAARFIGLTPAMTPDKQVFLDRYARIAPRGLFQLANAAEWTGDYKASAEALKAYLELVAAFSNEKEPAPPMPAIEARLAVVLALAGDLTRSDEIAAGARKKVDDMVRSGKALTMQNVIAEAEEFLDFQAIVVKAASGDIAPARVAFTGRTRWLSPTAAVVADLTARLRNGAKPAELTGALARDPAEIRSTGLAALAGSIAETANAEAMLYAAIRPLMSADQYSYWNSDIRDVADSDYLVKRKPKDNYTGEFFYMKRPNGIATGDALLMHCALLAKHRGLKGFVVFPARQRLEAAYMQFGNPDQPGFPALAFLDADTVIAALAAEFPEKPKRK